ncbi:ATP-binding response regulator [Pararobbsia alpina]|uniref:histidine kinase n=1 Tax=Pararobbsia alpina TaxID=621374 RepID=A0A6S7BFF4_9BURK|nr:hybrid sensor histidine kinase/response regulator [Pararobbsia alpina]CAB3796691.1 Sensor histidine kinase RcsC [Pararobbsia alpina]
MLDRVKATDGAAHILLLDDDEGLRTLACRILMRAGHRVSAVAEAESARAIVLHDRPDLLLLDYQLGSLETGLEFFRRLAREAAPIPAILLTGFADESRVIEALRAGVADVVPKTGAYLDYLPEAVSRVLEQTRLRQALAQAELLRAREEERERLLASAQAAQQAAEEANRAKDRFLAMLSHELRTPLSPVLATARMLERFADLSDPVRDDIRLIRRNIELEARLIDDLLDLTRVSNGKLLLALEVVDVHEALSEVLQMFREEIDAKRQRVDFELGAEHHHVRADRARLQQMLWNLVRNAAKFTQEGGAIILRTRNAVRENVVETLEIEVEDNGIGIDPLRLPSLFTAFEQGSATISQQYGGLGLGLAITRALSDAHGGSVMAFSEGADKGARFTLVLPVTGARSVTAERSERPTPPAERPLEVLLVEDHEDTADVMARLLEAYGHTVTTAGLLADALEAIERQRFDLVISDLGLPDGSGLDFVRAFRTRSAAPAVALTGYGMDDDVRRCIEAGFSVHLTKPVSIQQLERVLNDAASLPVAGPGAGLA